MRIWQDQVSENQSTGTAPWVLEEHVQKSMRQTYMAPRDTPPRYSRSVSARTTVTSPLTTFNLPLNYMLIYMLIVLKSGECYNIFSIVYMTESHAAIYTWL